MYCRDIRPLSPRFPRSRYALLSKLGEISPNSNCFDFVNALLKLLGARHDPHASIAVRDLEAMLAAEVTLLVKVIMGRTCSPTVHIGSVLKPYIIPGIRQVTEVH